jgi:glycerol-3-phosphate acyltransferase PlsY
VLNFNNIYYFIFFALGFLAGSIPFGYLIGRLKQIDIRNFGSGNIGFTNVYRALGIKYALPVFILDFLKGALPVVFLKSKSFELAVFAGLGAIWGHIFTPWLKFRGGKGVATTIGVSSFLIPKALFFGLAIYVIILFIFRYVSLASLSFAFLLPFLVWYFYPQEKLILIISCVVGILIIIRHQGNIVRLLRKKENKFNGPLVFRRK